MSDSRYKALLAALDALATERDELAEKLAGLKANRDMYESWWSKDSAALKDANMALASARQSLAELKAEHQTLRDDYGVLLDERDTLRRQLADFRESLKAGGENHV